ncbi:MAG: hypothetical protein FJW14_14250 [Acidimicrobiia bacterium]|nr:hypothetical protein [Acidimicrobiia bacterium]
MTLKTYLISLPERVLRSTLGLSAGVVREAGEVVLPAGVRRTQLYQTLVETTLRYVIENVGGAEGVYQPDDALPRDFLTRRAAGNAIELLGIVAFRASPVWVLAALADAAGMGRTLIPDIAATLKAQGLLDRDAQFTSVDEILDGLERTSSRVAAAINTPPLDVAGLRQEWQAIRGEARTLTPSAPPSPQAIADAWRQLTAVAARQNRSVFELSSMMALSAASRTGQLVGSALLEHYRETLDEIQQTGYAAYASRQLQPYLRAAAAQFSPKRRTLTERVLSRF